MTALQNVSVEQLRKALSIKEQIESLQAELAAMTGGGARLQAKVSGRRTMSAAAKAKIAAAQKARWAQFHAKKGARQTVEAPSGRRKMSAAARAKIAAAARARWAKAKAGGRNKL